MVSNMGKLNIKAGWFATMLAVILALPFALAFTFNLARDPFQIFIPDTPDDEVFLGGGGKSPYQHVGVVRHYSPRTIVVGHSLAANFRPTRVEAVLGWEKNYNLTVSGSPIYVHSRTLKFALEHAKIDQVLWAYSPVNMRLAANADNPLSPFPDYLYDHKRLNDLAFFATLPTNVTPYVEQKEALRVRLNGLRAATGEAVDPRDYANNSYFLEQNRFNDPEFVRDDIIGQGEAALKAYKLAAFTARPHFGMPKIKSLHIPATADFYENIRQNVYAPMAANPDTEFTLIIMPPLPLLYWQQLRATKPDTYSRYLAYVREAVHILSELDNLTILGFADERFAGDLRLYKDRVHYHMAVNDYMLDSIAAGREPLTPENVSRYLSRFDQMVGSYHLPQTFPVEEGLVPGKLDLEQARMIIDSYSKGAP